MKVKTFHAILISAVIIKVMAKHFEVLRTCRGSVAMTTIYVLMFDVTVCMNINNVESTRVCANMQSYVNIQCHLETFQALSTNFGDRPSTIMQMSDAG